LQYLNQQDSQAAGKLQQGSKVSGLRLLTSLRAKPHASHA